MVGKRGRESTRPDHSNRETGAVSERNYEKIEVRVWEYYSISELEACSLFFFYLWNIVLSTSWLQWLPLLRLLYRLFRPHRPLLHPHNKPCPLRGTSASTQRQRYR